MLWVFHGGFKDISKKLRKFPVYFQPLSRKFLKAVKSISIVFQRMFFVVVVRQSLQLPEQKEGLFSLHAGGQLGAGFKD